MMNVACYKSHGLSMEPFLLDGDELIVNTAPALPYTVGDIVLYRSPLHAEPVAHRLVGFGDAPGLFVLRADAYPTMTETVSEDSLIGRVECLKRNDAVIRVGGTRAATIFNLGIARSYPTVLWVKEAVARMLLPVVTCAQRLALYKMLASRFVMPGGPAGRKGRNARHRRR